MKRAFFPIYLILGLALAGPGWADWNPDDPAKWVQNPDLTQEGMDVNATHPMLLADDFLCETTGPITGIHLWGSWLEDRLPFGTPDAVRFMLSLHADIPAEQSPTGYSMPGEVLWTRPFLPGEFVVQVWAGDIVEGWFEPQDDQYIFPGDWTCFQYNFFIPEPEAYIQEGSPDNPIVYWLDVQAFPDDPAAFFGWKTSPDHWNDDAVWGFGEEPYIEPWFELRYPPGHPFYPESIDLAFVIQGEGEPPPELDFGDAPDSDAAPLYPTRLANNGARHFISGPWLGDPNDNPDPEPDGQPTPNADGDDLDGNDDEDGVQIPILNLGGTAWIQFEVNGGPGYVVGWIDYNFNFSWLDPGEQIVSGVYPPGTHAINIAVPASALPGQTFARFRITSNVALPPDGPASDGEVEDHEVFIEDIPEELDFGDAPDDGSGAGYATLLASNGARHFISGPWLGDPNDNPDPEPNGQPTPNADGDDLDGNDDEDGVQIPVLMPGQVATIQFEVNGGQGWVVGWVDYDQDRVWTAAEQVVAGLYPPGIHLVNVTVPATAVPGQTFARFRITSYGLVPPEGLEQDGEVEDHEVFIEELPPELDFGDAPDDGTGAGYATLLASNGARHFIVSSAPWLGPLDDFPDPEPNGQPDPNALGDDNDGNDDEDGVQIPVLVPGNAVTIQFQVSNGPGWVNGWIDFNQDRIWAGGELVVSGMYAGGNHLVNFVVPAAAVPGQTFARFRITSYGPVPPEGLEQDGEVEDHEVFIEELPPELDFGDAPDGPSLPGYQTLLINNGARHFIVSSAPWLGPQDDFPDPEPNGQPDPNGMGDDTDADGDDEDGVLIPVLVPGNVATIQYEVSNGPGWVDGWIDFNANSSWLDPGEQVISAMTAGGVLNFAVVVPASAVPGQTFARFRVNSAGPLPPDGLAQDGEVEDHEVFIEEVPPELDFGDAPDPPYPTWLASNGARHVIGGPWLGDASDTPDPEPNGQSDPNAMGDDNDGNDDEDGVQISVLIIGQPGSISFEVNGGPAEVIGWIDFNGDGAWQAAEQVVGGNYPDGIHVVNPIAPPGSVLGQTFARFRISTVAGLPPDGPAPDGEVEDHELRIIEEPQGFKWQQLPDLDQTGIDVNCTEQWPYLLADDFLCTQTGPLTQIQIWGSWWNDFLPFGGDPLAIRFRLSIHEDIPAEQSPTGYSMPGDLLHLFDFEPGNFMVDIYADDLQEGWLNPPEDYHPFGDTVCWLYTFDLNPDDTFFQLGSPDNPVVYWLDLQAIPVDPDAWFGWKTSWEHWNDDAVWVHEIEPYFGDWFELRYPPGHPFHPESIDLAFRIFGEPVDLMDFGDAPDPPYPTLLANNGARHVIGGPWLGDASDTPDPEPNGQPDLNAMGDDNDGNDDEDGVQIPVLIIGQPGTISFEVNGGPAEVTGWIDFNGDGAWQAAEQVVAGNFPDGTHAVNVVPPVGSVLGQTFARFRISTVAGLPPDGPAPDGEVEDHELQIIEGPQGFKWQQLPDLDPTGIDVNCTEQWPYLLADDFLCTQTGPLTQIQIWGSWWNDFLPFGGDPHAIGFRLSIHEDIPAEQSPTGYSMPGDLLHLFDFEPGNFLVDIYAENLEEGWMNPPEDYHPFGDTVCWLYTFDLYPDDTFFQMGSPDNPVVYWLDCQAIPVDPDAWFGWKTSWEHWNDDAVWVHAFEPYFGDWFELRYPLGHPFHPESIDLAFRIFGEPADLMDFGDAPDPPYPTWLASNGAHHLIVPGVHLGNAVDAEPNGQPHPNAMGDDNNGIDDEDGVFWLSGPLRPGAVASIDVIASVGGLLDAWVDFNGDGSWATPGDQIFANQPLGPGSNPLNFIVPSTGVAEHFTVARFRFSLGGGLSFTGPAPDGEVEDHRIFVEDDLTDVPGAVPQSFRLYQSTPNPFNPMTTIRFDLPSDEHVALTVFTVDGRRIATLVNQTMIAGSHEVIWTGLDERGQRVASGTYFYRIQAGPYQQTERMVLVK